mmetsp:Transcript_80975/g.203795  ORF Transcript_80975/g.203795 Transcript_80975/m.203795 type:complete len:456 (+) Transcript_80975:159-1526(+)
MPSSRRSSSAFELRTTSTSPGPRALPQSARKGHEVPGYMGHIPGWRPENVHGQTFRRQNRQASRGRGLGEPPAPPVKRAVNAPEEIVPGYMGHVPGKSENVFATGWADTKAYQVSALKRDYSLPEYSVSSVLTPPSGKLLYGRPGTEVPGYTGYIAGIRPEPTVVGGTLRNIRDQVAVSKGLEPTRRPEGYVPPEPPRDPPRGPHKDPSNVIPGYMGCLPGSAEHVHGLINIEANHERYEMLGLSDRLGLTPRARHYDPRTPQGPEVPDEVEQLPAAQLQSIAVPGYSGHVPGKKVEPIIGKTFRPTVVKCAQDRFSPRTDLHRSGGHRHLHHRSSFDSGCSARSWVSCSEGGGSHGGRSIASADMQSVRSGASRTMPGQTMRQPSLESLPSTVSSCASSSARRLQDGYRGGTPRKGPPSSARSGASTRASGRSYGMRSDYSQQGKCTIKPKAAH